MATRSPNRRGHQCGFAGHTVAKVVNDFGSAWRSRHGMPFRAISNWSARAMYTGRAAKRFVVKQRTDLAAFLLDEAEKREHTKAFIGITSN